MSVKLKLVVNNKFGRKDKFFVKKELRAILNLYARKVSAGDWKDYGLTINKKQITFDIYQRTSEKPIYRITKNLSPKTLVNRFYILDRNGSVLKKSENIESLINSVEWSKLKVIK